MVIVTTAATIRDNLSAAVLRDRAVDNVSPVWDALPVVDRDGYSFDEMAPPWLIARRAGRVLGPEVRDALARLGGLPGGTVRMTYRGATRYARTVGPDYRRTEQGPLL
jgi:hypothetical protein